MIICINNIDLAQTGAELALELWLREQESLMKNEIERRLDQQYGSYETAQKEFFKQRFGDLEVPQWIEQWRNDSKVYREIRLDKVNSQDQLAYHIADRFISHYKNHNQIDNVILMSGYLIADNSNIHPTSLGGGVTYYNYTAVDWYDQLSDLVKNTGGVSFPTISDPNYDAKELMAEYAITEMTSSHAKTYLLPRSQLKQGLEDYYYYNSYKQNALDFANRFFNG